MSVVGIVPAGGTGERLGAAGPKAFVALGGRPMLEWSVEVLAEVCDRVVAAVPAGHESGSDRIVGGLSRSASVRNGLAAAPEATVAVVHDAARPLVTAALVTACIDSLERDPGLTGVIAAAPVVDTIKSADGSGRVVKTLDRSSLWAVQTPQVFRAGALRAALDVSDRVLASATDDAGLIESAGGVVAVVQAPRENLKITTPLDLRVAEALLAERAGAGPIIWRGC